eukprot:COSAG02_NODE_1381_length_12972_cov_75.630700_10_plen_30_part_00
MQIVFMYPGTVPMTYEELRAAGDSGISGP